MSDPPPPIRPFSRGSIVAQTAAEAAALDARAIEGVGVPQPVLMENAGRSTALVVRALVGTGTSRGYGSDRGHRSDQGHRSDRDRPAGRAPATGPTAVALVGPGNNGGDALVALRSLAAWGWSTRAVVVADRVENDPLLHGWPVEVCIDEELDDDGLEALLREADVVLDGILGTGVQGAPRPRQARVIERLNAAGPTVVALDIPSGVDASTGQVHGAAVEAAATVSFGAPKVGALLHPGRARVGRHVTVEIGFPPMEADDASAFVATPEWARAHVPRRATDTHKSRVGRVVVVGGGVGMAGAAILAGQAAFRAGAGLVLIASVAANRDAIHGALPEAIVVDAEDAEALGEALGSADAMAVGPGLGTRDEAVEILRRVLSSGGTPLLIDADALNLAAAGAVDLAEVSDGRAVLITPHPGEMARLMGDAGGADGEVAGSRVETARAATERYGCSVLLKGAPSVVAHPSGSVAIDTQSSSDLAVAGMGDTLTGVCSALMAQGLEPETAGALGLYLTGRAARLADRGAGLTPSDVAAKLPDVLEETADPETDLELPFVIFDADPAR